MKRKLNLINSDIKYLTSNCSFGAGKGSAPPNLSVDSVTNALRGLSVLSKLPPKAKVLAVDTRTIVEICDLKIYIYFYPSGVGNKNAGNPTLMKTPWGKN